MKTQQEIEQEIEENALWWECKNCGENDRPGCHKCVRSDGKPMTDELCGD